MLVEQLAFCAHWKFRQLPAGGSRSIWEIVSTQSQFLQAVNWAGICYGDF